MGYAITVPYIQIEFGQSENDVSISTVAGDKSITQITLPTFSYTIKHAFLSLDIGRIYNSSAAGDNSTVADQYISAGGSNAITVPSGSCYVPFASTLTAGCRLMGNTDVADKFSSGGTTQITWELADAQRDNLILYDVTAVVRLLLR